MEIKDGVVGYRCSTVGEMQMNRKSSTDADFNGDDDWAGVSDSSASNKSRQGDEADDGGSSRANWTIRHYQVKIRVRTISPSEGGESEQLKFIE